MCNAISRRFQFGALRISHESIMGLLFNLKSDHVNHKFYERLITHDKKTMTFILTLQAIKIHFGNFESGFFSVHYFEVS